MPHGHLQARRTCCAWLLLCDDFYLRMNMGSEGTRPRLACWLARTEGCCIRSACMRSMFYQMLAVFWLL